MPSQFILSRVRFQDRPDLVLLRQDFLNATENLEDIRGFQGGQIWVNTHRATEFLTAYAFEGDLAAKEALRTLADGFAQEFVGAGRETPDTLSVRTIEANGRLDEELGTVRYISMSLRIAEPGLASQLQDDLRTVFAQCALIPGYTGSLIGVNEALEEETIGLVGWESEAAFKKSLPKMVRPKVQCYGPAFPWMESGQAVVEMAVREPILLE